MTNTRINISMKKRCKVQMSQKKFCLRAARKFPVSISVVLMQDTVKLELVFNHDVVVTQEKP